MNQCNCKEITEEKTEAIFELLAPAIDLFLSELKPEWHNSDSSSDKIKSFSTASMAYETGDIIKSVK